ncbi:transposase family protein [Streptomyces sp. TLI_185]|uniref:transposase family protein n=1 Tax=Streptomyces sp. TLI_185 TaxID=2485151 RepID=UPI0037DA3E17
MGVVAVEDVLFPGIDVRVTAVHVTVERVAVEATSCGRPPSCPDCGCPGRRVHSRYVRQIAERPAAGRPLVISLRVRRWKNSPSPDLPAGNTSNLGIHGIAA